MCWRANRVCAAFGRTLGGVNAEKSHAVTRFPAIGFWILALLVALALATQPLTAQDKAPNGDSSITRRVESALSKDAILGKLGVQSRTEAVVRAARLGMLML